MATTRNALFVGLRVLLSAVLIVAAGLKAHQLATEPVVVNGLFSSRWFLCLTIQAEFGFGLWMLLGPYPQVLRRAGIALFVGFGAVAVAKLLLGASSCGCFGRVEVSPLLTSVFDFGAAALLFASRPRSAAFSHRLARLRAGVVVALWLAGGIPASILTSTELATDVRAPGFEVAGDVVILEPEQWVGRPMPVLSDIDSGNLLARGEWLVVFYHHSCPVCEKVLPSYSPLGEASRLDPRQPRVALVEIPPFSHERVYCQGCQHLRLRSDREWFMTTPCEVHIRDGVALAVLQGDFDPGGTRGAAVHLLPSSLASVHSHVRVKRLIGFWGIATAGHAAMAVGRDADGDQHRARHHRAPHADFLVVGVQEQVRRLRNRPLASLGQLVVQGLHDAANLHASHLAAAELFHHGGHLAQPPPAMTAAAILQME